MIKRWHTPVNRVLLKSEDEGATDYLTSGANIAEIHATQRALREAGYIEQSDGTFDGRWFKAKITDRVAEGIVPKQRVVEYIKR